MHIIIAIDFELNSEEMSQELNSNEKWTHEWIRKRSSSNQSVGPPELTINYGIEYNYSLIPMQDFY